MSDDVKQVKVDNWGIYFLQRLKHFFNRTDYCDLTLQFQDNAQLKVHRLVLSACTEYFELLERTCEMYEDCLVMPDDLQADIVVPIVNFMYTGQLQFRMELLEKLHQCSEIMNMPVLTKLLDSHRPKTKVYPNHIPVKRTNTNTPKRIDGSTVKIKSISATEIVTTAPITYKRSHNKASENQSETTTIYRDKKVYLPLNKPPLISNGARPYREPSPIPLDQRFYKKVLSGNPCPTRYELPEELDTDNIFENSFCSISYASQPLMVHPETRKQYSKRPRLVGEASTSKNFGAATVDIVEHKKPTRAIEDALFEDSIHSVRDDSMYSENFVKAECSKNSNQMFDQILEKGEESSKVTIETKNNKSANLDHAKIISEVLKKYPHLVKSNKNIKLKILNTPYKNAKKQKLSGALGFDKIKTEKEPDFTFETDVLDSKQAARLIALGAENIEGPWICLICGTPGKAMNFTSYYKFRRHLVDVHHEKPVQNMCEYCGQRSAKRNYLLHHMYSKHGVEPPSQYRFPKCNQCSYIALSDVMLNKHKINTHVESKNFRCNVCPSAFSTSKQLMTHIQNTGHKYSTERKSNLQCVYCQKVFMREGNLCAHLKTHHKNDAIKDGIIDDSDEEMQEDTKNIVKREPSINDFEDLDIQYQIQQRPDGTTVVTKKAPEPAPNTKQKILNVGLSGQNLIHKNKPSSPVKPSTNTQSGYIQEIDVASYDAHEEIVMIDNTEYIMRDNQLIPRRSKQITEEYILSDHGLDSATPTTSMEFTNISSSNIQENIQHANMILKNSNNLTESIPIYVSNEEEYKALMTSSQSIIFGSSDSNKTLTVLTAPHTSTLETTSIDLDTTQSNDMMIIQDEYPLNVPQTVVSENSNIVVVYSHSVDDQNKQYQLLSTQGLEAQFVQSSAILTQNYETVTTAAPIMNTHVLGKEVRRDWQSNLQQIVNTEQIEITPVPTNIQAIVEQAQVEIINTIESDNEMNDLPQVEITSNVAVTTSSGISISAIDHCQDMVTEAVTATDKLNENVERGHVDNTQNLSSMETDDGVPVDEQAVEETIDIVQRTDAPVENITGPEEIISQNDSVMEEAEYIESQTYTQPDLIESQTFTQPDTNSLPVENIDEVEHVSEEISIDNHTTELENIEICNEGDTVSSSNNISDVTINVEQVINKDTAVKVHNLASEWSEEDTQDRQEEVQEKQEEGALDRQTENIQERQKEDTPALHDKDTQVTQKEKISEVASHDYVSKTVNTDQEKDSEMSDIEESIENIQQEVEKQMATTSSTKQGNELELEVNDVDNSSQDNSGHETITQEPVRNPVTVIADLAVAQEKISSLLNDWEDNDSQEDNDSVSENVTIAPDEIVESEPIESTTESTNEIDAPDKQDKIKSLVSDWDEDEEENKD